MTTGNKVLTVDATNSALESIVAAGPAEAVLDAQAA
jgi:hypothetical protein